MPKFLSKVAQYLLENHKSGEVQLIFPNRRAALFLREEYQHLIDQPHFFPRVMGIEEFIEQESGLKIIGQVDQLFIMYEAYKQILKDKSQSFTEFIGWAQVLLHDFTEMDQHLIPQDDFFQSLHEIRQIESFGERLNGPTELQLNYSNFWKNAALIHAKFKEILLRKGFAYSGLAAKVASEKILNSNHHKAQYLFAGFSALTRSEEVIIKFLIDSGNAQVLWDADKYYVDSTVQEAGMFFRSYIKKWNLNEFKWKSNHISEQKKNIEILGVAQQNGQVKIAGDILNNFKSSDKGKGVAVVLAEENLLIPLLQSIPSKYSAVNVTMGYPLKHAPLFDLFNQLIRIFTRKKSNGFYFQDFLQLINNQHFELLFSIENNIEIVDKIERFIIDHHIVVLQWEVLPEELKNNMVLGELYQINRPGELLEFIIDIILSIKTTLLINDDHASRFELEHLLSFYQLFNRIKESEDNMGALDTFDSLEHFFKQLVAQATIDFKGEPLEGLQIMGMLETRNLDFDKVILISANEGILPSGKTHNSFVPYDVKRKFNLPTYKEKDAMFAYHFYHLIQRTSDLHIIYNTENDDFGSGEKSRFVTQIENEFSKFPNITFSNKLVQTKILRVRPNETLVKKDVKVTAKIKERFKKGLSPTSINTYLNCSLDFYYQYVLGLKEKDEFEEEIEASTMGSVIHEVLEKLYEPYVQLTVTNEIRKEMLSKVDELILKVLLKSFNASSLQGGKNLLSFEVAKSYIKRFLINENEDVKIVATEEELDRELKLENIDTTVKIRGKIDRVDEVNGLLRIIDYKTGNVNAKDLEIKSMEGLFEDKKSIAIQLLTYAFLSKDIIRQRNFISGIISFRNTKAGLMKLDFNDNHVLESRVLEMYETILKEIVHDIMDPNKPFMHSEDAMYCKYCSN